jgi:cell division protein FtsB
MSDLVTIVSEIEFKARKLTESYQVCKTQNEQLKAENEKLQSELEDLKLQFKKLEYSKHILKIAKALEKEKGSTEAKRILNGLLREVDRCIGLLND